MDSNAFRLQMDAMLHGTSFAMKGTGERVDPARVTMEGIAEKAKRFGLAVTSGAREAPPRVSRFYASHSVPYGRAYRMYTTRGELIAYVNRGQIADPPRAPQSGGNGYPGWALSAPTLVGIPIYNE